MPLLFVSAFGLGLAFCAPPGAVTAEALRRGLERGFWSVLLLELGSLVGDATWAALALFGAAAGRVGFLRPASAARRRVRSTMTRSRARRQGRLIQRGHPASSCSMVRA